MVNYKINDFQGALIKKSNGSLLYIWDEIPPLVDGPANLVDYNPDWEILAQNEIEYIKSIFPPGSIIAAEHIGSTSIKGIKARNCIAINFAVKSVREISDYLKKHPIPEYELVIDLAHEISLCKNPKVSSLPNQPQSFQIYFLSPLKNDWIMKKAFRDYMNANLYERDSYENMKLMTYKEFIWSCGRYCRGKTDFCYEVYKKIGFNHISVRDYGGRTGRWVQGFSFIDYLEQRKNANWQSTNLYKFT